MSKTILIVDDEPGQRLTAEEFLSREGGYRTIQASGGKEALDIIFSGRDPRPDLVLLDLAMPGVDGMQVLGEVHALRPDLPVIVVTANDRVETAVAAMKAGASDFIVKPLSPERLRVSIVNALKINEMSQELSRLQRRVERRMTFDDLVGHSPEFQSAVRQGKKAASSDIPVLMYGERGVGKECFARAIHGSGARQSQPFVTVTCGLSSDVQLERLLFGYEKGAIANKGGASPGKIREAHGGTLFLDEIADIPSDVQLRLLNVLRTRRMRAEGADYDSPVDVRVISASCYAPDVLLAEDMVHEELLHELGVLPIFLPPLHDREEDIDQLAAYFLQCYMLQENKKLNGFSESAMEAMRRRRWQGNVRQLEHAIFRAVVLSDRGVLEAEDLFPEDRQVSNVLTLAGHRTAQMDAIFLLGENGHIRPMEDIEMEIIQRAIAHYGGRMSKAARVLGIGRSTLYRKIQGKKDLAG